MCLLYSQEVHQEMGVWPSETRKRSHALKRGSYNFLCIDTLDNINAQGKKDWRIYSRNVNSRNAVLELRTVMLFLNTFPIRMHSSIVQGAFLFRKPHRRQHEACVFPHPLSLALWGDALLGWCKTRGSEPPRPVAEGCQRGE